MTVQFYDSETRSFAPYPIDPSYNAIGPAPTLLPAQAAIADDIVNAYHRDAVQDRYIYRHLIDERQNHSDRGLSLGFAADINYECGEVTFAFCVCQPDDTYDRQRGRQLCANRLYQRDRDQERGFILSVPYNADISLRDHFYHAVNIASIEAVLTGDRSRKNMFCEMMECMDRWGTPKHYVMD